MLPTTIMMTADEPTCPLLRARRCDGPATSSSSHFCLWTSRLGRPNMAWFNSVNVIMSPSPPPYPHVSPRNGATRRDRSLVVQDEPLQQIPGPLQAVTAMQGNKWLRHFKDNLTATSINQFLGLWNEIQDIQLLPNRCDSLSWKWTATRNFSTASAYALLFSACIQPPFAKLAWKSDVPPKCQFFVLLAAQGRCLTADNLACRQKMQHICLRPALI